MAGTRRYLWTQRVKYPNREDMRSKVSSRISRGQLDDVPALSHEVVEDFFLIDRLTTKGTSQRGYIMHSQKLKFETSGKKQ